MTAEAYLSAIDVKAGHLIVVGHGIEQVDRVELEDRYTVLIWIDGQTMPLVYDKYEQVELAS